MALKLPASLHATSSRQSCVSARVTDADSVPVFRCVGIMSLGVPVRDVAVCKASWDSAELGQAGLSAATAAGTPASARPCNRPRAELGAARACRARCTVAAVIAAAALLLASPAGGYSGKGGTSGSSPAAVDADANDFLAMMGL